MQVNEFLHVQDSEEETRVKTFTTSDGHVTRLHRSQLETHFEDHHKLFANVTKLSISCSAYEHDSLTSDLWQNISQCACNLEELTIFENTPRNGNTGTSNVTYAFLQHGEFPKLHKLYLYDNQKELGIVDANKFMGFVYAHRNTLDEIVLRGIFLTTGAEGEVVGHTIRASMDMIRAELRLSKFEMQIYRRDEHVSNGDCTAGGWNICNGSCETYSFPRHYVHRIEIGQLAQELNVFQHAQGWNFGDYVMRPREPFWALLQESLERDDRDKMAGLIASEWGPGGLLEHILGALPQAKGEVMAATSALMAIESDDESASNSHWEVMVEGKEVGIEEETELDWDSDDTM